MPVQKSERVVFKKIRRMLREEFVTLTALPNIVPFNDMMLDGILTLDGFRVKTRSTPYWERHLGERVLLYNSTKIWRGGVTAHGYKIDTLARRALVGTGRLVAVRELTKSEKDTLFEQFNNWTPAQRRAHERALSNNDDMGSFAKAQSLENSVISRPLDFGLFFKDVHRFKEPVPFAWPSGPVREYPIPLSLVAQALRQVGVNPDKIEKVAA